jgi:hypothetical protein
MNVDQVNATINLVLQIVLFIIPIAAAVVAWFLRTYVKSSKAEKDIAAITRLSNAAIDFAEDLDKRGDLEKYLKMWNMPDDVIGLTSNGLKKLNLAGKWLETELGRQGIQMTDEEAKNWIAAQFQNQTGDIGQDRGINQRTQEAVSLLQTLHQSGVITLPSDSTQVTRLSNVVSNWVVSQLGQQETGALHEQAQTTFESALTPPAPAAGQPTVPSLEDQVDDLARQSVQYVEQLKASHELTLSEVDIAVAWVLTEVTKRNLPVTTGQIAGAVNRAFAARGQQ